MLRWLTAGESHGPALVAVLEGLPAGVSTSSALVADELARRRLGHGRGARMAFERDDVEFLGGVRHGLTMGGPIAIRVGNTEWPKWETVMAPDPVPAHELEGLARNAPLTRPRPGHADLVGMQKYGFDDARPVLERASARETAARVALGAVIRTLEEAVGCGVGKRGRAQGLLLHIVLLGRPDPTRGRFDGKCRGRGNEQRRDVDGDHCGFDGERSSVEGGGVGRGAGRSLLRRRLRCRHRLCLWPGQDQLESQ